MNQHFMIILHFVLRLLQNYLCGDLTLTGLIFSTSSHVGPSHAAALSALGDPFESGTRETSCSGSRNSILIQLEADKEVVLVGFFLQ